MIGFTQPGKLVVQNIKMFEQTWTDAQTVLPTTLTPGYTLMLVSVNLVKSQRLFNGALMTATSYPSVIYIVSGDQDVNDGLFQIQAMGDYQTPDSFWWSANFSIMKGIVSPIQTGIGDTFFRLKYDGNVPSYKDKSYNPYCYLSLAYYLVPSL